MKHHGGKLGRGNVDLNDVQNKIAAVTARAKSEALKKKVGGEIHRKSIKDTHNLESRRKVKTHKALGN